MKYFYKIIIQKIQGYLRIIKIIISWLVRILLPRRPYFRYLFYEILDGYPLLAQIYSLYFFYYRKFLYFVKISYRSLPYRSLQIWQRLDFFLYNLYNRLDFFIMEKSWSFLSLIRYLQENDSITNFKHILRITLIRWTAAANSNYLTLLYFTLPVLLWIDPPGLALFLFRFTFYYFCIASFVYFEIPYPNLFRYIKKVIDCLIFGERVVIWLLSRSIIGRVIPQPIRKFFINRVLWPHIQSLRNMAYAMIVINYKCLSYAQGAMKAITGLQTSDGTLLSGWMSDYIGRGGVRVNFNDNELLAFRWLCALILIYLIRYLTFTYPIWEYEAELIVLLMDFSLQVVEIVVWLIDIFML